MTDKIAKRQEIIECSGKADNKNNNHLLYLGNRIKTLEDIVLRLADFGKPIDESGKISGWNEFMNNDVRKLIETIKIRKETFDE